MIRSFQKQIKIQHDLSQPSIPVNILVNSKKANNELRWKPKINIDDGIRRTIKWLAQNM